MINLDERSIRNFVEYVEHASAWAKNHENESRLTKMDRLLQKDEELSNLIREKTMQKTYPKLWVGNIYNIEEDTYVPNVGDVIRRGDNAYQRWTRRKSCAVDNAGYGKAADMPQTGGVIVRVTQPVTSENVILDTYGLYEMINELRKTPDSLRASLSGNPDYMYRLFNAGRRMKRVSDLHEIVTSNSIDTAKVEAQYVHNRGLMETNGSWRTSKATEMI